MSILIEVSEFELWFKKNQRLVNQVLIGVLVAGALYSMYSYRHRARLTEASALLAAAETAYEKGDGKTVQDAAGQLKNLYADTHQASLAVLQLARYQADKQQLKESEGSARWVIEHAPMPAFTDQARLHLAQLQIQNKQWDDALSTLKAPFSEDVFNPTVTELIADIYAIKGSIAVARSHYQKALTAHPQGNFRRDLIEYKLNNLTP